MNTYCPNGSTALSEQAQARQNSFDARNAVCELMNITAELLAESQWSRILQVSTTDLDDMFELLRLLVKSISEFGQGRNERPVELCDGSDVHRGREAVIR